MTSCTPLLAKCCAWLGSTSMSRARTCGVAGSMAEVFVKKRWTAGPRIWKQLCFSSCRAQHVWSRSCLHSAGHSQALRAVLVDGACMQALRLTWSIFGLLTAVSEQAMPATARVAYLQASNSDSTGKL